jgi:hypothetical protein
MFDHLWCKIFELRNFEVLHHLNAHHVRYLCIKWRNFSELFFLLDKNPNGDMKVLVHSNFSKNLEKNEISKLHEECKIAPSPV